MSYHWYLRCGDKVVEGTGFEGGEPQALFCLETGAEIWIENDGKIRAVIRMSHDGDTYVLFRGFLIDVENEFDRIVAKLEAINLI